MLNQLIATAQKSRRLREPSQVHRYSIGRFLSLAAIAGTMAFSPAANSAELTFLCAEALQPAVDALLPEFQKATRHTVKLNYANIGANTAAVRKGDAADLVIISPTQWDSLQKEGRIDAETRVLIGRIGIGVFVKKGVPRPDISSVETFKSTLVYAKSIALRDGVDDARSRHRSAIG